MSQKTLNKKKAILDTFFSIILCVSKRNDEVSVNNNESSVLLSLHKKVNSQVSRY